MHQLFSMLFYAILLCQAKARWKFSLCKCHRICLVNMLCSTAAATVRSALMVKFPSPTGSRQYSSLQLQAVPKAKSLWTQATNSTYQKKGDKGDPELLLLLFATAFTSKEINRQSLVRLWLILAGQVLVLGAVNLNSVGALTWHHTGGHEPEWTPWWSVIPELRTCVIYTELAGQPL